MAPKRGSRWPKLDRARLEAMTALRDDTTALEEQTRSYLSEHTTPLRRHAAEIERLRAKRDEKEDR